MVIDIVMPKMGESITEGTILEWKKEIGEFVEMDEILLEIGTDKVDSEIMNPYNITYSDASFIQRIYKGNYSLGTSQNCIEAEAEANMSSIMHEDNCKTIVNCICIMFFGGNFV